MGMGRMVGIGAWILLWATAVQAENQVTAQHNSNREATAEFKFAHCASPAANDAAGDAEFSIVVGRRDRNGGDLAKLHDGHVPSSDDEPRENFFFAAGSDGGRLLVDLHKAIDIRQINTYSWHRATRAPQVYQLYASKGDATDFNSRPATDVDPTSCGWVRLASVDTRSESASAGGQYGVSIAGPDKSLGEYRYLLFDISRTEADDAFGNTFFSEIDVIDQQTTPVAATPVERTGIQTVEAGDGKYHITIDTSETPDLDRWVKNELIPTIQQWYPKIVDLLPSEGYKAPRQLSIVFRKDMPGVAATGGIRIQCAANWFRGQLQGEAKGAVVHELVHVVQQFGRARRPGRNASRTPGWLVEGMADYIRWFLYEPQTHGAEITRRSLARARYDASYRVSANFLNWVTQKYDPQLVPKLNAAAREGRYNEKLWEQLTGHSVQSLGEQWKASLQEQLGGQRP